MLIKLDRAFAIATKNGVHDGLATQEHIHRDILGSLPSDLIDTFAGMSSKQLAVVILAAHHSYHNGRASTGAEMFDDSVVWVAARGRSYDLPAK